MSVRASNDVRESQCVWEKTCTYDVSYFIMMSYVSLAVLLHPALNQLCSFFFFFFSFFEGA